MAEEGWSYVQLAQVFTAYSVARPGIRPKVETGWLAPLNMTSLDMQSSFSWFSGTKKKHVQNASFLLAQPMRVVTAFVTTPKPRSTLTSEIWMRLSAEAFLPTLGTFRLPGLWSRQG